MEKFSKNFKKLFLLYFTKELILHSKGGEILQLQNVMTEQVKQGKDQFVHSIKTNIFKKEERKEGELKKDDLNFYKIFKKMKLNPNVQARALTIPEPRLPPHLQYLKPVPKNIEIDLEKLNPLMKDPAVKTIECNGPNEHIFVKGTMGTKPTSIILSNEEINSIIKTFSDISKIPSHIGVYRVVAGRLILSAIISEVIGSKFIIKKMLYAPNFQNHTYPQPMIE